MSDIFTCGIDVGSTASKAVILKNGTEIVGKSLVDVGTGTSGPERAIREVFEDAGKAAVKFSEQGFKAAVMEWYEDYDMY